MAGVDVPRFLGAEVGDNPDTWRAAGLHVDAGGVCNVGSVAFTLTGTGARGYRSLNPGVASYTIATPAVSSPEERTVLGLTVKLVPAVVEQPAGPSEPHPHPSGASRIMKTVILGCDTDATVNALSAALGDTIMNKTNSDPGGDGNHFAIWRMRGMEMFEVADLLRTDPRNADGDLVLPPRREQFEFEGIYHTGGAYTDEDKFSSVFIVVPDVEAVVEMVGAEFCEAFDNYLPRKGYKVTMPGLSISLVYILPPPEGAPKL